jgi:MSHA pilin protein MshD
LIRQRGFTLVELVVAMVVIGLTISALLPLLGMIRYSADPVLVKQSVSIAESLMDEVRLAAFTWCDPADTNFSGASSAGTCASVPEVLGPETGNSRPYDNVNDYNVYCTAPMNPITDVTGVSPIPFTGYSAKICVTPYAIDLNSTSDISTAAALKIEVEVSKAGTDTVTLTGWRTRYAPNAS